MKSNKNLVVVVLAVLAMMVSQIACDSTERVASRTWDSCDSITGCVYDTPKEQRNFCRAFLNDLGVSQDKINATCTGE